MKTINRLVFLVYRSVIPIYHSNFLFLFFLKFSKNLNQTDRFLVNRQNQPKPILLVFMKTRWYFIKIVIHARIERVEATSTGINSRGECEDSTGFFLEQCKGLIFQSRFGFAVFCFLL
jgi:hypothetical protein